MSSSPDSDRLRELAEAATPGPWLRSDSLPWLRDQDAALVAALDPQTVLGLLADRERLTQEGDEARGRVYEFQEIAQDEAARAEAAEGRLATLTDALRECIPYVRNAIGPGESPWRIETATGVLGRIDAALAAAGEGAAR